MGGERKTRKGDCICNSQLMREKNVHSKMSQGRGSSDMTSVTYKKTYELTIVTVGKVG